MKKRIGLCLFAVAVAAGLDAVTETFHGKVVEVADGDTIVVLPVGRRAVRIRVDGIDCPEFGQAYSYQAKQFTVSLVFGKQVRIEGKERDRLDRLVARVFVGEQDLSVALVQAGLAWHYVHFSADPVLIAAERAARSAEIGVWSETDPVPPWDYRHGRRERRETSRQAPLPRASTDVEYHGNRRSRVYHAPGCRHYNCGNCTVLLRSKEEAESQGFKKHTGCVR